VTTSFRPGDQVSWWKRISQDGEHPYRAEVLKVGAKRVTIAVEDPDGGPARFIRHVTADSLQPVGAYHGKATAQSPRIAGPAAAWGRFTRYLEIGEDLRAVRQVDVFENGNMLSYDRGHWVDAFGMLAEGRINRNRRQWLWGQFEEIDARAFERVWVAARASRTWHQQVETAQMARMGAVPVWFTIRGWRPRLTRRRT
jgi:hypothetical protein